MTCIALTSNILATGTFLECFETQFERFCRVNIIKLLQDIRDEVKAKIPRFLPYEKREKIEARKQHSITKRQIVKKEVVGSAYLGQYIWIYSSEPQKRNEK